MQLVIPRVELHLFYNAVVFAPMVAAIMLYMRPAAPVPPTSPRTVDAHAA